jgi:hypothetical protein
MLSAPYNILRVSYFIGESLFGSSGTSVLQVRLRQPRTRYVECRRWGTGTNPDSNENAVNLTYHCTNMGMFAISCVHLSTVNMGMGGVPWIVV